MLAIPYTDVKLIKIAGVDGDAKQDFGFSKPFSDR